MKPIAIFFAVTIILFSAAPTTAQNWKWGKQGRFTNHASGVGEMGEGTFVAAGTNGTVFSSSYIYGPVGDTIFFGPYSMPLVGEEFFYINKYDSLGNIKWFKTSSCSKPSNIFGNGIAADRAGNVYASGAFYADTISFDAHQLIDPTPGYSNFFLLKYNGAGNVVWARNGGGYRNSVELQRYLQTDNQANLLYCGAFWVDSFALDGNILINANPAASVATTNNRDIFLTKIDSNNNIIWARSAGGTGDDFPTAMTIDKYNNTYITGVFRSASIVFGGNSLTSTPGAQTNNFIVKYDPLGNIVWSRQYSDIYITGLAADSNNRLYVTGYFGKDTVMFDTVRLINNKHGSYAVMLASYNNGKLEWAKNYGTPRGGSSQTLVVDAWNTPWVGIGFSDTLIVGKDSIISVASSVPNPDGQLAIIQFDSSGNPGCYGYLPKGGDDYFCLTANPYGYIFFGGDFNSNTGDPFYVGPSDTLYSISGTESVFVAKFQACKPVTNDVQNITSLADLNIYPNPAYDRFTIQYSGAINNNAKIELYNISGSLVFTTAITNERTVVSTTGLAAGMYICRLVQDGYEPAYRKLIIE